LSEIDAWREPCVDLREPEQQPRAVLAERDGVATASRDEVVDPLTPAPEVHGDGFDADPGFSRRSSESLGDALDRLVEDDVEQRDDQAAGSGMCSFRRGPPDLPADASRLHPCCQRGPPEGHVWRLERRQSPANTTHSWTRDSNPGRHKYEGLLSIMALLVVARKRLVSDGFLT
jgi:hypothetical protein